MAKPWISIFSFFTILCLWSSTAVFSREIPTEENNTTLQELKTSQLSHGEQTAHTTTCGGFITVKNEHEIRYQVPFQENRNENEPKFCIWIVENSQLYSLVLELKDVERGQDFQLWTISGFRAESGSVSAKIDGLGSYPIPRMYFALYFRLNSSSTNNNNNNAPISFSLNIKSNISDPLRNRQRLVKRIELSTSSPSTLKSFKYPLPPSTEYSERERTFIILNPTESGSRLRLRLKSVDTQKNHDYIEIMTFSDRPVSRFRISGNMTTEREFRSGKDEPILVFFRSDRSKQRSGFSFDYAEENQSTCGGFVQVLGEDEISYQVPSNTSSSVCIWVVSNELAGELQVQLTDQNRWTHHESTELFIINSIKGNSSQKIPINIQNPSLNFSSEVDSYFLVYFRFNPNLQNQNQNNSSPQGFRLRLQGNPQESSLNYLKVSQTELTLSPKPTATKNFSYPVGASGYLNNERAFIIIKPTAVGSKIKVDMTAIHTESCCDPVKIMSYSEEEQKMTYDFSFSGTFREAHPRTLKGRENEPVIVFFSSDHSTTSSGFRFTYSEVRTNAIS